MANETLDVTRRVVEILDDLAVPYLIGGSLASTYHGVARTTLDSDIVADLRAEQVGEFVRRVKSEFYVSVPAVLDAILQRTSFNLIHLATLFKVDIFLPKDRTFETAQFQRRRLAALDAESGHRVYVASAEDTILAKLEWYRLGGEGSDRQWLDVTGIVRQQGRQIDWKYIEEMGATLGVSHLVQRLHVEASEE